MAFYIAPSYRRHVHVLTTCLTSSSLLPSPSVEAGKRIVREEGWLSLFGRGLGTRILANGLQGILFSVLWKVFQDLWNKKVSH